MNKPIPFEQSYIDILDKLKKSMEYYNNSETKITPSEDYYSYYRCVKCNELLVDYECIYFNKDFREYLEELAIPYIENRKNMTINECNLGQLFSSVETYHEDRFEHDDQYYTPKICKKYEKMFIETGTFEEEFLKEFFKPFNEKFIKYIESIIAEPLNNLYSEKLLEFKIDLRNYNITRKIINNEHYNMCAKYENKFLNKGFFKIEKLINEKCFGNFYCEDTCRDSEDSDEEYSEDETEEENSNEDEEENSNEDEEENSNEDEEENSNEDEEDKKDNAK